MMEITSPLVKITMYAIDQKGNVVVDAEIKNGLRQKNIMFVMDKKNTFELEVIGSQKCFGDLPALSTYRFNNGRRFPLSYIRFVTKYGYGLTVDLFHIYIPLSEHGDSIFIRSDEIRSTYYKDVVNWRYMV